MTAEEKLIAIRRLRLDTEASLSLCAKAVEATQTYDQAKEFIRLEHLERGRILSGQFLTEDPVA